MPTWKYAITSADAAPATAPLVLRGEITANLALAASFGYQGLEVHTRENVALPYDALLAQAAEKGMGIAAIVTGRLNTQGKVDLIDERPYIHAAAMQGLREYIAMAARLNTDIVVGWLRGTAPEPSQRRPCLDRLAESLSILCGEAAVQGVRLYLEVINRYESNLLNTAAQALAFVRDYRLDKLLIHLDTFHMNIEEADAPAAIRACEGKLGHFHVADNTRLCPGSGQIDFAAHLRALRDIAYSGYVSVECIPSPDGESVAAKALAHLRACEKDI